MLPNVLPFTLILLDQFDHLYFRQETFCNSFAMAILVYLLEMSSWQIYVWRKLLYYKEYYYLYRSGEVYSMQHYVIKFVSDLSTYDKSVVFSW
jgi:hypothetical protein